jgi:hypothetical protein
MKKRKPKKPEDAKVLILAPLDFQLIDRRPRHSGLDLGTIESAAKQYGVKIRKNKDYDGYEFIAPISRLQMFVEKLHFSGVPYLEL